MSICDLNAPILRCKSEKDANYDEWARGVEETIPADSSEALTLINTLHDSALSEPGEQVLPIRDPDRYIRGEEIARGGMGKIIAFHDKELNRDVAVKELSVVSEEAIRRFQ